MTIADRILNYAFIQKQPFLRRDLMRFLAADNVSEASAHVLLTRMVEQGKLVKAGYGVYALPEKAKTAFVYRPSEDEQSITQQLKAKFPFADFCVWKPSVLGSYMRHVPALGMTLVDVERVAMESVFSFLQRDVPSMPVLLNPTSQECARYITTDKLMIVRVLVDEAPVIMANGMPVPTLEKILVDAAGDKELVFAQGAEIYTIYEEAFGSHNVNRSRLLRYAARRHRKDQILEIINSIES